MTSANGTIPDSEQVRLFSDGVAILNFLEERFRAFGASHFLVTGLPLPGRPIEPLILKAAWGEPRGERLYIDPNDPVLRIALRSKRPFLWDSIDDPDIGAKESLLLSLAEIAGPARLVGVPIVNFLPYQASVIAAGKDLDIDVKMLTAIDCLCDEAFRRLFELCYINRDRPGDLSTRERKVISLSAVGKTASEIADELKISQRTVHAHLQNASEKLRASNKTHTVVEALRYGQITV
jgi:LuxR family quorum sensing-dependent transcriptional regulator